MSQTHSGDKRFDFTLLFFTHRADTELARRRFGVSDVTFFQGACGEVFSRDEKERFLLLCFFFSHAQVVFVSKKL